MTFIGALRFDRVDAPWVIDGPINGSFFTLYAEKVLAPTLKKGDVVILDNLGSHKGEQARKAIRAAGAHLIFLPPPAFAGAGFIAPTSTRSSSSSPS